MKLRTQDLFLILAVITPILLFVSYWAAEGFRTPLSQRYSLYVAQDPTLPVAILLSFAVSAYLGVTSVEPSERRTESFNQAARWFFLPVYLAVTLVIMFWYRYDFGVFPVEGILLLARSIPAALAILLTSLLILSLGILSLSSMQRKSLNHSLVIIIGALLIFGGAFLQFFLSETSIGSFNLGYSTAASASYVAMVAGAVLLFFSLRRFARTPESSAGQAEKD